MANRVLKTPEALEAWIAYLQAQPLPMTVTQSKGADRTRQQNATIHLWFGEIAAQREDTTPGEVKAECNLQFGRPILARDNPDWEAAFGYIFDNLSYQAKLKAVRVLDVPFTRGMKVTQLTEYMDEMTTHYRSMGVFLTDPELRKYEDMNNGNS